MIISDRRRVYLVDTENVGKVVFDNLDILDDADRIIFFESCKTFQISLSEAVKLNKIMHKVEVIKTKNGQSNAMDFMITTILGHLVTLNKNDIYIIISNDKGYDGAIEFWKSQGIIVRRHSMLGQNVNTDKAGEIDELMTLDRILFKSDCIIYDKITEGIFNLDNKENIFNLDNKENIFDLDNKENIFDLDNEESVFDLDNEESVFDLDNEESVFDLDNEESVFDLDNEESVFDLDNNKEDDFEEDTFDLSNEIDELIENQKPNFQWDSLRINSRAKHIKINVLWFNIVVKDNVVGVVEDILKDNIINEKLVIDALDKLKDIDGIKIELNNTYNEKLFEYVGHMYDLEDAWSIAKCKEFCMDERAQYIVHNYIVLNRFNNFRIDEDLVKISDIIATHNNFEEAYKDLNLSLKSGLIHKLNLINNNWEIFLHCEYA